MKKKRLITIILVTILVGGAWIGYTWLSNRGNSASSDESDIVINYDPATDQEVAEGEEIKRETINEETGQDNGPTTEKTSVTPIIGYLDSNQNEVSINAYIPKFVESDGTCTLTLTKGSVTVTEQKTAMPDAQSTICGQMVIERSRLTSGSWEVKISYSSSKLQGTSEPRTLEVK